jgi:hypothetical protein
MVHGKHFSFSSDAVAFSFRILELAGALHCSLLYQQILMPPKHGARNTNANAGRSSRQGNELERELLDFGRISQH